MFLSCAWRLGGSTGPPPHVRLFSVPRLFWTSREPCGQSLSSGLFPASNCPPLGSREALCSEALDVSALPFEADQFSKERDWSGESGCHTRLSLCLSFDLLVGSPRREGLGTALLSLLSVRISNELILRVVKVVWSRVCKEEFGFVAATLLGGRSWARSYSSKELQMRRQRQLFRVLLYFIFCWPLSWHSRI